MDSPLVSVIIPTYNRAHIVTRAIASASSQTYKNIEIIVVDDGSTDNTQEVLSNIHTPNLVIIHQENQGVSAARNHALAQAQGKYVTFCDSDDWLFRHAISNFVREAENHPHIDCWYAHSIWSNSFCWLPPLEPEQLALTFCIQVSALFIKKSCAVDFDPTCSIYEDWLYTLQLIKNGATFKRMHMLSSYIDRYQPDHLHTGFEKIQDKQFQYRGAVTRFLTQTKNSAAILILIYEDAFIEKSHTLFLAINHLRLFLKQDFKVLIITSTPRDNPPEFHNYLDICTESDLEQYLHDNSSLRTIFMLKPHYLIFESFDLPSLEEDVLYYPCIIDGDNVKNITLKPNKGWGIFPTVIDKVTIKSARFDDHIFLCTKKTFFNIMHEKGTLKQKQINTQLCFFETDELI